MFLSACDAGRCTIKPQLHLADSHEYNGKPYFLYTRTTGFQEKQVFFELYDQQPSFDDCGVTQTKAIFVTDYDHQRYVKELVLQPDAASYDDRLRIVYTDDVDEGFFNVNDIKFRH